MSNDPKPVVSYSKRAKFEDEKLLDGIAREALGLR